MQANRFAAGLGAVIALSGWVFLEAGQLPPGAAPTQAPPVPPQATRLPLAPGSDRGTTVTPSNEGWFRNDDGTVTFLVGYMNRNSNQALEIPVGPNNHIDPNGPDYNQPTFFETGRQVGVFTVTVPKDFGTKRLTWTLVANGLPQAITLWINQPYVIAPFVRADNGNTPPVVKFSATGPEFTGPPRGFAQTLTATVAEPLPLTFWVSDKGNTVDQQNQFGPPISTPPPSLTPPASADAVPGGASGAVPAAPGAGGGGRGGGRGGGGRGGGAGRGAAPADPQAVDAAGGTPPDAAGAARGAAGRGGAGGRGGGAPAAAAAGRGGGGGGGGGRGGGAPVRARWVKHRGPGTVTFANAAPPVVPEAMAFSKPGDVVGKVSTTATFSAPGEYVLRGQVNDTSGQSDGCCWTNVHVKVTVKAAGGK